MTTRTKNIVTVCIMTLLIFGFFIWSLLKPDDTISESERRNLAQFPEISGETLISGTFMTDFEEYTLDQFPLREEFRSIKAFSAYSLFMQKDNQGIYVVDGYLSKLEYPLNSDSLDTAAQRFRFIYDTYLKDSDTEVYFSIIPDKNCFMADENGYPSLDYNELVYFMRQQTEFMEYIDIGNFLELSDYYRTDTHWRQEKIVDVAQQLAESMGSEISPEYTEAVLDTPFYGVYYGQSALSMDAEQICYLYNDTLNNCTVYDYETDTYIPIYDLERADGQDPYEIFLSGSKSLLTIENPNAETDEELIIFRDSFGSSIAPLFVEHYAKVTLVDIRYVSSNLLSNWIEFEGKDVLFLYSTMVLNNSVTLK